MATQTDRLFLRFNSETNQFEWVPFSEFIASEEVAAPSVQTVLEQGDTGVPTPAFERTREGSLQRAAAGLSAFSTVADVITTFGVSPLAAGVSAIEGVSTAREGFSRAEIFEAAKESDASVSDLLAAHAAKPSLTSLALTGITTVASLLAGGGLGLVASGARTAADLQAFFGAEEALERAGELEREVAVTGEPTLGGFGFVNTVANIQEQQKQFAEQQAANLMASAIDEEPTQLAPGTARETIAAAIGSARADITSSFAGDLTAPTTMQRFADTTGVDESQFFGPRGFFEATPEEFRETITREGEFGGGQDSGTGGDVGSISPGEPGSVGHGGGIGL